MPGIDFYELYQKIEGKIEDVTSNRKADIIIVNDTGSELSESYYQLHFALYGGINTGRFLEMKKNIDDILSTEDLASYRVWVDEKAVYLQLDKDNDSFYCRIAYKNKGIKEGG